MEEKLTLFDQLLDNSIKSSKIQSDMYHFVSRDKWKSDFQKQITGVGMYFADNLRIAGELDRMMSAPLNKESADCLYHGVMQLYDAKYGEYKLLLKIMDCLIPYYEREKDYECLAHLYMAHFYETTQVKNPVFSVKEYDFSYIYRLISLREHYFEMKDPEARFLIIRGYYIIACIGLDNETIRPKISFQYLKELQDFFYSEKVQELDGNHAKMNEYVMRAKKNITDAIYTIDEEEEEVKEQFCRFAKENYISALQETNNEYELDPVLYASYLYVLYLHKERDKQEIFVRLLDLLQYGIMKYQKKESLTESDVEFMVNITRVLFRWAKDDLPKNLITRFVDSLKTITDITWNHVDKEALRFLNQLLRQVCGYILYFPDIHIDKERLVNETIIKRNFFSYIHAMQIERIVMVLWEEAKKEKPSLFSQYGDMEEEEFRNFLVNCAHFHDIGKTAMIPFLYEGMFPMSEEEQQEERRHPHIGVELISNTKELKRYHDVILYHHKDYDGKRGYPEDADNTKAKHRILADLIHLSDEIDALSDRFVQKGHEISFEQLLEVLKEGKGTKYHPELVDVILASKDCQNRLQAAVNDEKYDIMFDYYQELDNVINYQNPDVYIAELNEKMYQVLSSGQTEGADIYLERMFQYARREHSDLLMGMAYYYSVHYYQMKEEYMNAINSGREAIRYLERTEEYKYLAGTHILVGTCMQYQGNPENGIGHYIQAIEYAGKIGNVYLKGSACNNLASIFRSLNLFEKAIEYYLIAEECSTNDVVMKIGTRMNLLYCYIMQKDDENAQKYYEKVSEESEETLAEIEGFTLSWKIYRLLYVYFTNQATQVEALLTEISNVDIMKDYKNCIEEINVYLNLLGDLERYEELTRQLDVCIHFCKEQHLSHSVYNSLLQKRIQCAYRVEDLETSLKYGQELDKLVLEQKKVQSQVMLQLEDTFLRDIQFQSEKRNVIAENERLEKTINEEKSATEAKTAFLSSMSHEIRTPIHAIIGLNEMILRETKEEQIRQYAKDMEASGKNLLNIINDVLDFSKMEAGKVEIIKEKYKLKKLLSELVEFCLPKGEEKKIAFELDVDPEIPNQLFGDHIRLKQIISNLLSNAFKYTHDGSVRLQISLIKKNKSSVMLRFAVKDTGIGIKEEEISKLMRPFERADMNKNKNIEGTGLGLSIVSMLASMMGGKLEVDSEYEKGSEFSIQILQDVLDWEAIGIFELVKAGKQKREILYAPNAKILVVDDNKVNLKVVSNLLKRSKVHLTTAESGKECLLFAKKELFDLILLDHFMPEMDGIETLKRLKTEENQNQNTPVIALTANSDSGAYAYYTSVGFEDFIAKPVDPKKLEEKVTEYLPKDLIESL